VERDERPIRVGGQALPDGVMMRTERAWAIARSDGSIDSGPLPSRPCAHIPVLRVIASLGPAMLLGLRGGRGRSPKGSARKRTPWALIRGLVVAQLAVVGVDWLAGRIHLARHWAPLIAMGVLLLAIAVFRAATPAAQWRFHGAEHKAIAAHERGIDPEDTDAVLTCSRVHPRCGTNLIVWMGLAAAWLDHLSLLPQLVGSVLALAVIAEIMTVAARHPASLAARVLQAPGELLQWAITTSEPKADEQRIGCRALVACLTLDTRLRDADAAAALIPA
jgi:uncharacterized protein YqhQ